MSMTENLITEGRAPRTLGQRLRDAWTELWA